MQPLCTYCHQPYVPPVARPEWPSCMTCTLGGGKRAVRFATQRAGVAALAPLASPGPGAFAFRIPGSPLGINEAYAPGRSGRRIRLTAKGVEWKKIVRRAAAEVIPAGWPLDQTYVLELFSVFISPRADSDGPTKLVKDALQGLAYENDVQVVEDRSRKGPADASAPRLEVIVRMAEGPNG